MLVVDDDVDIAELLSEALRIEGFQTAVEHDARAALERWRNFVPHAAVLDVGLPDVDGYQLARTLRAEHGKVPTLIAATGYGRPNDRLRAVDAGFDCHFVKPVSVQDIVLVLDQRVASPGPSCPRAHERSAASKSATAGRLTALECDARGTGAVNWRLLARLRTSTAASARVNARWSS